MSSVEPQHVTLMFTDIEGSTRLWEEQGRAMEAVLAQHDDIVHGCVAEFGGSVFKHTGDGMAAAFSDPVHATRAAIKALHKMNQANWGPIGTLVSRIGIHSGLAQQRAGDYFGRDVNRAARIMDAGHGGQVLISAPTAKLLLAVDTAEWLVRDLGMHRLKDLSQPERVFQLYPPDLPSQFPALRTVDRMPRQLPALAELFIGREEELQSLGELLGDARLISLIGPGGVGKTELAIAAASDQVKEFPDGVWFCALTNNMTIEQIAERVESIVGLQLSSDAGAVVRLTQGLATRRLLLILDGAEKALVDVKAFVATVLECCHSVSILCTSREILQARREQVTAVGPLRLPEYHIDDVVLARQSAAIELFERRAKLADSDFQLTADNLSATISICQQLDGLPLALELAAAQMAVQEPRDLAKRIGQRIGLIDDREQTLRTILDWSYQSLSLRERMLFQHLAVFSGGFTLEIAERICAAESIAVDDVMPVLGDLVAKSVVSTQRTFDGRRYVMLELLRSYAVSQVSNVAVMQSLRQRHLEAYIEFAASAQQGLETRYEADWVKRINIEFANLRAAFTWAIDSGQVDLALRVIHYTDGFARERFRRDIDSWAEIALHAASGDEAYLFAAKSVMSSASSRRGDSSTAIRFADEAVDALRRSGIEDAFMPFRLAAITAILSGNADRAQQVCAEALERAERVQQFSELTRFQAMMAYTSFLTGTSAQDRALADNALQRARGHGNPSILAWCLFVAGSLETQEGSALALFEEAIEFADMVDNRYIVGIALQMASWKRRSADQGDVAAEFRQVINHWYRVANWTNLVTALTMMIESSTDLDDELVAVTDGWLEHASKTQSDFNVTPNQIYLGVIADTKRRFGTQKFRAAADRGATMNVTQIVQYCLRALEHHAGREPC